MDSLARRGGNLTGFTRIAATLAGKRLELLKETFPKLTRVAVLWVPGNLGSEEMWQDGRGVAEALGLQLHSMEVTGDEKLAAVFHRAVKTDSGAVAVTLSAFIIFNKKRIADLAMKNRLPTIYERREFTEAEV